MTIAGSHSVVEAVGTHESMMQAIRATRPGGHVGLVEVTHGVELLGEGLFFTVVHLYGGTGSTCSAKHTTTLPKGRRR